MAAGVDFAWPERIEADDGAGEDSSISACHYCEFCNRWHVGPCEAIVVFNSRTRDGQIERLERIIGELEELLKDLIFALGGS